ncbi:MAG: hypothetical protein QHH80_00285 [Anaerolineae bacterium]|jgi:hypothetical protein|nr:hypothetical protein [Anaerolineae bacterium]
MAETTRKGLNASQYQSVILTLRLFEERLRQADAWLAEALPEGVLYRYTRHLPSERVAEIRAEIAAALRAIADLAQHLEAQPADEPIEAAASAFMSVSWADLSDVKTPRLARYGAVDNALEDWLDPRLDALAEHALRLAALFGAET